MTDLFVQWAKSTELEVTDEHIGALDRFEDALYIFNEVKNLTRVPRSEAWSRHWVDSLLFQDLIPFGSKVLDIGTGPGIPAWPLACFRPDLHVTAIDSNGKMIEFLKTQPLPNLTAIHARVEDWNERAEFDVVTGRAVAPFSVQMEISAGPTKLGGTILPMRTEKDIDEIQAFPYPRLNLVLKEVIKRSLPGNGAIRVFPLCHKPSPTPPQFPRRWPEIKKAPL